MTEKIYRFSRYTESETEENCVRCLGGTCFVLVGLVVFALLVNQITVGSADGKAPEFARSALWSSIAYHTQAFKDLHPD